jgi:hypothetical protein
MVLTAIALEDDLRRGVEAAGLGANRPESGIHIYYIGENIRLRS